MIKYAINLLTYFHVLCTKPGYGRLWPKHAASCKKDSVLPQTTVVSDSVRSVGTCENQRGAFHQNSMSCPCIGKAMEAGRSTASLLASSLSSMHS